MPCRTPGLAAKRRIAPDPNTSQLITAKRHRYDDSSPERNIRSTSGSRNVSILDRLERLERGYTAHRARVSELESTITALKRDLYGANEGQLQVDSGAATTTTAPLPRALTSTSPEQGSSHSGVESSAQNRRVQSARDQREKIKQEPDRSDLELEEEDNLYDATPLPPAARAPPAPSASSAQASSSTSALPIVPTPSSSVAIRMPHPVRNLPLIHQTLEFPPNPETFSHQLILNVLGGHQICDGYYETSESAKHPRKYAVLGWFALDREREPYAPPEPGHHGAKLSIFMQDTEGLAEFVDLKTHLFVRNKRGESYTYFGTYQEPRFSDKLDYSRMIDEVPQGVKTYWAQTLAAKNKPRWNMDMLVEHGLINRNTVTVDGQIDWDLADELAEGIKPSHIMDAFDRADMDEEPSMRFYWEYLRCTGYDMRLYETLLKHKLKQERN